VLSSLTNTGIWNQFMLIYIFLKHKWTTFYETNKALYSGGPGLIKNGGIKLKTKNFEGVKLKKLKN
jgi:hypothetical protein